MELLKNIKTGEVIFLDIETARLNKALKKNTPEWDAWAYKCRKEEDQSDKNLRKLYVDRAALEPEFSKVICISTGMIVDDELLVESYTDADEAKLLRDFNHDLEVYNSSIRNLKLSGWAVIGFDIPFIFKRCMANRVTPSPLLETAGEKPWTLADRILDLKDLWKGTGFAPTSLICASVCLGVPHPKQDISGGDVGRVYYGEGDAGLERIRIYCEADVLSTANVYRALRFEELVSIGDHGPTVEELPLITKLANGAALSARMKKKVEDLIEDLPDEERPVALEILQALAESKKTKVTRSFVRTLKDRYAITKTV